MINKKTLKINILKNGLVEILFPWFIFLDLYEISIFPLSSIFLIVLICIKIFSDQRLRLDKDFALISIFIIFSSLLFFAYYSNFLILKNLLFSLVSIFSILFLFKNFNFKLFYKSYSFAAIISIVGIFIQAAYVYFGNNRLTGPIVAFPSLLSDSNIALSSNRPMSFFAEPQAFATYILVFIILSIYRKKVLLTILSVIAIFLSGSSLGILMIIIILPLTLLDQKMYKSLYIVLVIGTAILLLLTRIETFNFIFEKIMNIDISNDLRLANGFKIYFSLPLFNMVFGSGIGNFSAILDMNDIPYLSLYRSSISGILIDFGAIFFVFYIIFLFKNLRLSRGPQRIILISLLILSFGQTIFLNSWFTLYMGVFYILKFEKKNKSEVIK